MAPDLKIAPLPTVKVKKGGEAVVSVHATLPAGYHANSNTPSEDYLIPMTLKWADSPLGAGTVTFPKPSQENYSFSKKPLSVFSGDFEITTKFKVPATAPNGPLGVAGSLRYQACNERMCFAPRTVKVNLTVSVE